MNFGFTACHTSVPSMQKVAVYAADALRELEAALRPQPARKPVAAPTRAKPRKDTRSSDPARPRRPREVG
jgi:hypothetical protein